MTTYIKQEEPNFCFLACLESFLAENAVFVSQREILKTAPEYFGGNQNDLGAFAGINFCKIEAELGFKAAQINAVVAFNEPKESIFALCEWEERKDSIHWVRLLKWDTNFFYLMNPACDDRPQPIEIHKFNLWLRELYKIEKT